MANICLIGLNYAPEPIGIGPYSEGWAVALRDRGHCVQVICGVPYYPEWQLFPSFENCFTRSCESDINVIRVPHYIPAAPSGWRRIVHYASFARNVSAALRRYCADDDFDAVVAIAPSLMAAPVARGWAKSQNSLSWLHVQDFEVEAALATGLLPGWLAGLGEAFEKRVMRSFDQVSTIAPAMVARADQKIGRPSGVQEHRNWAEPQVGMPGVDGRAMRRKLALPGGIIALYSGNLALKQGVGVILEAARQLRHVEGLNFVICGEGPAKKEVVQASKHLSNLYHRPLQPREDLPGLLAMADMHLLPQIAGAADLMLPSKLPNMLASGRPVVATADPGTSLNAEVAGCGIVVDAGDPEGLSVAVETLAGDEAMRTQLGEAARNRAQMRWSKQKLLDAFCTSLERAIEERQS